METREENQVALASGDLAGTIEKVSMCFVVCLMRLRQSVTCAGAHRNRLLAGGACVTLNRLAHLHGSSVRKSKTSWLASLRASGMV